MKDSNSKEISPERPILPPDQRTIGLSQGVLYGMGCGIGGSIFILLGTGIEVAGPGVLISLIFGGILIFFIALNYSEVSISLPISGGAYNFSKEGMGGFLAFIIGFFLWIANIAAFSFSAQAFTLVIEVFFPVLRPVAIIIAISIIIFISIAVFRTKMLAIRTLILLTLILISIFGIFIISGLFIAPVTNSSNFNPSYLSSKTNPFSIIQMFSLLFVFFTSITSNLAYLNSDFKNPSKTIPRVNILAIITTLFIYLAISYVVLINIGSDVKDITKTPLLLADVLFNILGPIGFILMGIAAIISTIIAMNAALGSATSVFAALARDKYFPQRFAKINEKTGVPVQALILTTVISLIFTIIAYIYASIGFTAEITVFIYFFGLAFINFAVFRLRYKRKELDRPFKAPFFPFLPIIVTLICLILAFVLEFNAILLGLIILAIGLGYYLLTLADRHSIIITLAGIKFSSLIFMGVMIWTVANIAILSSTIVGLNIIFREIFLRVLIYICIFGLVTVILDIIPLRELAYLFIKKVDKDKVAINIGVGQIIELNEKTLKRIHKINDGIAIGQIISSAFIFFLVIIIEMNFLSIEEIKFFPTSFPQITAEFFFSASLVLLGICFCLSGIQSLYINRELVSIGI